MTYPRRALYLLGISCLSFFTIPSQAPAAEPGSPRNPDRPAACITDPATGLVWERKDRDNRHHLYTWSPAVETRSLGGDCETAACTVVEYVALVNRLAPCGRRDWRVPRLAELATLIDYRYHGPAARAPWRDDTDNRFYWSASETDNNELRGIGFSFGLDYAYDRAMPGALRLVAGGPSIAESCRQRQQRFVRGENGELTDNELGLRWAACPIGQYWRSGHCQGQAAEMEHDQAKELQDTLWRMPTVTELRSLTDPDCPESEPLISSDGRFWSDTPQADHTGRYWALHPAHHQAFTLDRKLQARVRLLQRR